MSKELEQKSAALEQALEKQLSSFKKGSEDWVKVGAAVAVGALVVYGLTQLSHRKKEKNTDKALEVLEREGLLNPEIKEGLRNPKVPLFGRVWLKRYSFWDLRSQRISCTNNFLLNPKNLRRRTAFEVHTTFEVLKNLEGLANI